MKPNPTRRTSAADMIEAVLKMPPDPRRVLDSLPPSATGADPLLVRWLL